MPHTAKEGQSARQHYHTYDFVSVQKYFTARLGEANVPYLGAPLGSKRNRDMATTGVSRVCLIRIVTLRGLAPV